jgi:hypothetical protein
MPRENDGAARAASPCFAEKDAATPTQLAARNDRRFAFEMNIKTPDPDKAKTHYFNLFCKQKKVLSRSPECFHERTLTGDDYRDYAVLEAFENKRLSRVREKTLLSNFSRQWTTTPQNPSKGAFGDTKE